MTDNARQIIWHVNPNARFQKILIHGNNTFRLQTRAAMNIGGFSDANRESAHADFT